MRAGMRLPRMSTSTRARGGAPAARASRSSARASARTCRSSARPRRRARDTLLVRAQHAAVFEQQSPVSARAMPASRCATSALCRRNRALPSSATVQARPDSSGVTVSSMSLPYRFMPASSRSVSRAPSPQGATPGRGERLPEVRRRFRGQRDLEAVLAGIAGARDEPSRRRRRRKTRRARPRRRGRTPAGAASPSPGHSAPARR